VAGAAHAVSVARHHGSSTDTKNTMTRTLPGADIRGFYAELGIQTSALGAE
jgi:hypothetical protein